MTTSTKKTPPFKSSDFLRPHQVAEKLGCSRDTVYRLLHAGLIPGCKAGGRWYIHNDDLEAHLRGKKSA